MMIFTEDLKQKKNKKPQNKIIDLPLQKLQVSKLATSYGSEFKKKKNP